MAGLASVGLLAVPGLVLLTPALALVLLTPALVMALALALASNPYCPACSASAAPPTMPRPRRGPSPLGHLGY